MQYLEPNKISADQYVQGVLEGDLVILAKALSLMESSRPVDEQLKVKVLERILPKTGNSFKIGITGAPGVGKSTFIEALGLMLSGKSYKLAVLTIDPSSRRSGGSILGDKTRMEKLANTPGTFIRPSASGNNLGGLALHTRESILLCEAAGYDIVLVETVGVGQSEVEVRDLVDYCLLLLISGAGDELQGLKKGIVELADGLAINKADGDNLQEARLTQTSFQNALHYLLPGQNQWQPKVFTCSSVLNTGVDDIWSDIELYRQQMQSSGYLDKMRKEQRAIWMDDCINQAIDRHLKFNENNSLISQLKEQVEEGSLLPNKAAEVVLEKLLGNRK